ncbi:MAG: amino acid adenylation domain-containing protein [Myxococcaceae bacterium]|nr:amino acid adenylation domain-containing protein [Myxococcaceae bacterium]
MSEPAEKSPEELAGEQDVFCFPASFAQSRLWFLDRLDPASAAYNMPFALRLTGALEAGALERSLSEIYRRHEALRTRFEEQEGEVVQLIYPPAALPLVRVDVRAVPEPERRARVEALCVEAAGTPFELTKDVLVRATLFTVEEREHVLLLVLHHIVSDGWSMGVFARELVQLYAAFQAGRPSPLPELELQYVDYSEWQREWMQGEGPAREAEYWKEQLAPPLPVLELPGDRARPAAPSHEGATRDFSLGRALTARLSTFCQRQGVTPFMALLAGFQALLHRYTGAEELVVGTPVANRTRVETEGLIGFFTHTLALRTSLAGNPSLATLARRVKEVTLGAFAHQELPFEKVVELLQVPRHPSHSPVFQVMFVLENAPQEPLQLPGLTVAPMTLRTRTAKFDLTLSLWESNGGLSGHLEYSTDLFEEETMRRLVARFRRLLEGVDTPDVGILDLPLLDADERGRLEAWGRGPTPELGSAVVAQRFEAQARRTPEATALLFGEERLTYAELDARANRLAHLLGRHGVGPEVRVGLCVERSVELVVGLLAVLKAGGAYLPLEPDYPRERLAFMLEDGRVSFLLAQAHLADRIPSRGEKRLLLEEIAAEVARESSATRSVPLAPEHLAYVMYTSGSTGRPKGVAVTHRGICRLVTEANYARLGAGERVLQFAPISFDASTLEVWGPLLNGGAVVVAPPGALSLEELGRVLGRHGVTTLWLTAGLFHQMVEERLEGLASVKQLLAGGDVVSPTHVRAVLQRFPDCTVINGYGPTESTTFTCCHRVSAGQAVRALLPVGRPIPHTEVLILDARLRSVPPGIPGELYIGGAGLARGYLDRPELTAERFVPHPTSSVPGARLYRTGDLARFLPDGTVEFLGRMDGQVKVRGFRIELGEIEEVLRSLPEVRDASALVRQDGPAGKRLSAFVAPAPGSTPSPDALRAALASRLPAYMVPAQFTLVQALPLGPNGKVDRARLLALEDEATEGARAVYRPPSTQDERNLAALWMQVLGVERPGLEDDFFALGGHSLLATRLVSRIQERFGVSLPLRALFEHTTLGALAAHLGELRAREQRRPSVPLKRADRARPLPLSFSQQRLWFLDRLEAGSAFYNVYLAVRLEGALDPGALEEALRELVRRHEVLRTRFPAEEGEPRQEVLPEPDLRLERADVGATPAEQREAEALRRVRALVNRPFELAERPPLRALLVRMEPSTHLLALSMHHIISDAWSLRLMVSELGELYAARLEGRAPALAPLPLQYADFALWQREWLEGEALEPQRAYWVERLKGALPVLQLPHDRPRPARLGSRGGAVSRRLSGELARRLRDFGREEGVTSFMALLAAFDALLLRLSGQGDLLVGAPISGRTVREAEGMLGCFVNTLVLRVGAAPRQSFRELLAQVKQVCLEAYAHQELPFERLVELLQPERSTSHHPLFQVMLSHNEGGAATRAFGATKATPVEVEVEASALDLTLITVEHPEGLTLHAEYSAELFDAGTVARVLESFERILDAALAAPDTRLGDLPVLGEGERQRLLVEWNDTWIPYPREPVHALIAARAARAPDAIAVSARGASLTYGELMARAHALAHHLAGQGVRRGDRVGVCLPRGVELVVALLGILETGAAYVPLDPDFPRERLDYMVSDARLAALVTTTAPGIPALEGCGARVELGTDGPRIFGAPAPPLGVDVRGEDVAYVIYTSGSTGRPKGVVIPHGAVVNLLQAMGRRLELTAEDSWAAVTTISFDIAAAELFLPLLVGARVVLLDREVTTDALALAATLEEQRATVMQATPTTWRMLVESGWAGRGGLQALAGGEALPEPLARALVPRCRALWNFYGPTETTIWSTCQRLSAAEPVTIGRPLDNTTVYLLDGALRPVPRGVAGDLFLGGEGLAHGYHGRPELTAERFLPDPFRAAPGARMYRTGDIARYRADGTIEWLGRGDFQVKVRGFRIELGDIESALRTAPGVREAVVVARPDGAGGHRLAAYCLAAEGTELTSATLREHLSERLPPYMLPAAFVAVAAFPMTLNGKIDRTALPEPSEVAEAREEPYAPPRDATEAALQELWRQVLGRPRIGVHDSFFELGGDSISAMRLSARARARGLAFSPHALLAGPTIAQLAQSVTPVQVAPAPEAASVTLADPAALAAQGLEALHPLTPMQRGMLVHALLSASREEYAEQLVLALPRDVDLERLREAWSSVMDRHAALRSAVRWLGADEPVQAIHLKAELPWVIHAHGERSEAEHAAELARLAERERRAGFELTRPALFRLAAARSSRGLTLVWTFHHLMLDGWSAGLVLQHVAEAYAALGRGQSPARPKELAFREFVAWLAAREEGPAEAYWRERFQEGSSPSRLLGSTVPLRMRLDDARYEQRAGRLGATRSERLRAFAARHGLTLNTLFQGAWALLLSRYTGSARVQYGTLTSGRGAPLDGIASAVGMMINLLPLVTELSPELPALEWLRRLQGELLRMREFESTPLEHVHRWSGAPSGELLFESLLVFDPGVRAVSDAAGGLFRPLAAAAPRAGYPLHVGVLPDDDVGVELTYDPERFDAARMDALLAQLTATLDALTESPARRLGTVRVLPADQLRAQLETWNATATPYPAGGFLELFEAHVRRTPEAVAVTCEAESLTYAELHRRALALAGVLAATGVGPESIVGLLAERSPRFLGGILAAFRVGAAYLPLDPGHPPARWAQLLGAGSVRAVLVEQRWRAALTESLESLPPERRPRLLALDSPWGSDEAPAPPPCPEDPRRLAYVLFTSGSTGVPKGVMVEHGGMVNHLHLMAQVLGLGPGEVLAQTAPQCFDISVWQFLNAIAFGGRVHILRDEVMQEPARLLAELEAQGVTVVQAVPSLQRALLDTVSEREASRPTLHRLRWFIPTGEALPPDVARDWFRTYPRIPLLNAYGPAECSDDVTLHVLREAPRSSLVPIGRPVPNLRVYVLDAALEPVPVDAPGELFIGGLGVGRGYLNDPARTAERYLPDPFSAEAGARMYRSGDLVRYLPDGTLEFIGRTDFQVKVRGFRIELGEIEAQLLRDERVKMAVVVARAFGANDTRLVAYLTLRGEWSPERGREVAEELRSRLGAALPPYMVPAHLVPLEQLPLNANGKVDRKALPAPDSGGGDTGSYVAPRDEEERALAAIWAELLSVERVGATDDFFTLGGHSLLALRLLSRVERALKVKLRLDSLFQASTLESLAALVRAQRASGPLSPRVLLREGTGRRPPLFLVHPVGGNVLCYRELVARLPGDRSYYGLRSVQAEEGEAPSLERMAADYVARVREVQPEGPYALAGWSLGGVIAFEMARQLEQAGQQVERLAVIDGMPLEVEPAEEEALIAQAFCEELGLPAEHAEQVLDGDFEALAAAGMEQPGPADAVRAAFQLFRHNARALHRYRPEPRDGALLLIEAREAGPLPLPLVDTWRGLSRGGVEHLLLAGRHETLLRAPYVDSLVQALSGHFDSQGNPV